MKVFRLGTTVVMGTLAAAISGCAKTHDLSALEFVEHYDAPRHPTDYWKYVCRDQRFHYIDEYGLGPTCFVHRIRRYRTPRRELPANFPDHPQAEFTPFQFAALPDDVPNCDCTVLHFEKAGRVSNVDAVNTVYKEGRRINRAVDLYGVEGARWRGDHWMIRFGRWTQFSPEVPGIQSFQACVYSPDHIVFRGWEGVPPVENREN